MSDSSAEEAHKRYEEFVQALRRQETVYYLMKDSKFGCCIYEDEAEPVILFWTSLNLAEACLDSKFDGYEMSECSSADFLEKILPYLNEKGGWIGVNYDRDVTGISVKPKALMTEVAAC